MRESISWCEILICITALTILIKILKDRYSDLYGKKKMIKVIFEYFFILILIGLIVGLLNLLGYKANYFEIVACTALIEAINARRLK
jgi:hypothetical protein